MDKRIFMLLGMIILLGGIIFLFRYFLSKPDMECDEIVAYVSPQNVFLESGDSVSFSDDTPGAEEWLWEFGDGASIDKPTGKYLFTDAGHYTIKLTVNGSCTDTFSVWVNRMTISDDSVKVIIEGPKTVRVGQRVQYKCISSTASSFSWKFGESGIQDSRDQNPYYTFQSANTYKITVATDAAKTPGELVVTVLPKEIPKSSPISKTPTRKAPSKDEIKSRLQMIANTGSYNSQDLEWIKNNFSNGTSTKVICNLKGTANLAELFEQFGVNSNVYIVLEAIPTVDNVQMVTSVNVKVKEK